MPTDPLVRAACLCRLCAGAARSPGDCRTLLCTQAFFSKTGADGVSVRSHLAELIHSLLLSKDPKALEKLESISLEVKAAHYDGGVPAAKVRRPQRLHACLSAAC